jgi:hypothetical protein
MKVFLPNVDKQGKQALWRMSTDVSVSRLTVKDSNSIQAQEKLHNTKDMMFFFNKPPKWNERKCRRCW